MQHKILIAALLALAVAAPAQAKIDNGQNNPGNGELFLSIWDNNGTADSADDRSYTRDLGIALNSFASAAASPVEVGPQPTYLFSADALLTSWLAGAANLGNLRWNVAGFDAYSQDRAAMTVSAGFAGTTQNYSQFRGWATGAATHLAAVNALGENTNNALNVSSTATSADGAAYSGSTLWGNNVGTKINFSNDGGIGDSLDFWMFSETVSSGSATTVVKQSQLGENTPSLDRAWTLDDNGVLAYGAAAPVPEADTYAFMALGMGLVGLLARRRKVA